MPVQTIPAFIPKYKKPCLPLLSWAEKPASQGKRSIENKTREIYWRNIWTYPKDFRSSYFALGAQMKILKDDINVIKISLVVNLAKMDKAWLKETSGQFAGPAQEPSPLGKPRQS